MKTRIITTAVAVLLLGVGSSCTDFLNESPETVVSASNFYKTKGDFEQAIAAVYAPLEAIYDSDWQLNELRSDNTFFAYDVANRGSKPIEDLATFTVEVNNVNVRNNWLNNYLIIARANHVLKFIDNVDLEEADKNNLKGQALFLRSLAYYTLAKNFGDVPIYLEPSKTYDETFQPRSPVAKVYEQIIADASAASKMLPVRNAQTAVGRATSGSAYTLLGSVYLTLKDWANAESALKNVEKMGYELLADHSRIFSPSNKGNVEIVFEVNYVEATPQPLFSTFPYSFLPKLTDPSVITGVTPGTRNGSGGLNVPTPDLLSAFDAKADKRYGSYIGFYSGPSPLVGMPQYENMPYIKKFQFPHAIPAQTNMNWPIYRYAEVLLMLAESLNEQGKGADAVTYLNLVRKRAGLEGVAVSSQSNLRTVIFNERRLELAFENKRWHDLVRSGRAIEVMNAFGAKVKANPEKYYYTTGNKPVANAFNVNESSLLYPIPLTEIVVNNKLTQNPGY